MHVSWGFYVDSTLLLLNVLASASVLLGIDKHLSADNTRDPTMLPQHLSLQGSYESPHVPLRPTDVMIKRNDEQTDDLWVRRINILTNCIPYTSAAPFLALFYHILLFRTLESWHTRPPQPYLTMTMGRLRLTMRVVSDLGAQQRIPWAFVRNFAINMMAMTAMGFTGTYDMYYMTPPNPHLRNLAVEVRLGILWD